MEADEPSLFRLYGRSRYRRVVTQAGPAGELLEEKLRKENERFAVAAVAFCLRHCAEFRQVFWKAICQWPKSSSDHVPSDPDRVPPLDVELAPDQWADLRLIAEVAGRRTVWVIEFKVDAELEPKQDPTHSKFVEPKTGYGALYKEWEIDSGSDLRYVVLGSVKLRAGGSTIDGAGIRWHARKWRDLAQLWPDTPSSLMADLYSSLAQLPVSAFAMKDVLPIRVSGGFGSAAEAWNVLDALRSIDYCNFPSSLWKIEVTTPVPHYHNLGATLYRSKKRGGTRRILESLSQKGLTVRDHLLWAGYETGPEIASGIRRSIWVCCDGEAGAEKLKERLMSRRRDDEISIKEKDPWWVVISSGMNAATPDLEWFNSVLHDIAD